jgi:hypothetical protein
LLIFFENRKGFDPDDGSLVLLSLKAERRIDAGDESLSLRKHSFASPCVALQQQPLTTQMILIDKIYNILVFQKKV